MRADDMLRAGLDCAVIAARGGDWCEPLARAAASIVGVDAAFAVCITEGPDPARPFEDVVAEGTGVGITTPSTAVLAVGGPALAQHPALTGYDWSHPLTTRVSDAVRLPSFWATDVWQALHAHGDGRYPAAVLFGRFGPVYAFLGMYRATRDFSDDDMEVLDRGREPLGAALAFRYAWDNAAAALHGDDVARWVSPLTPRERQVSAFVASGWTDARIARQLGISERTVRKHLENVRAKWQAPNRAAVASLYERRRD